MERFEGADNLVAEMNFGEEFDINNAEAGLKYTLNGTEISYDEYTELCGKIFAAEVNTNFQGRTDNDGQVKKDDELEALYPKMPCFYIMPQRKMKCTDK